MIHLLPSELQQYLSKFVNNVDVYMRINKELYEESKQDTLRRIRLLDPDYLEQFVEDFERLIAETED